MAQTFDNKEKLYDNIQMCIYGQRKSNGKSLLDVVSCICMYLMLYRVYADAMISNRIFLTIITMLDLSFSSNIIDRNPLPNLKNVAPNMFIRKNILPGIGRIFVDCNNNTVFCDRKGIFAQENQNRYTNCQKTGIVGTPGVGVCAV